MVLHPESRSSGDGTADSRSSESRLVEARALAGAIDLTVVQAEAVRLGRPRPATLFGPGAVGRYAELIAAEAVEVVVVNHPLTPIQQRNLELAWTAKVVDRTGLILEIFGARARTHEGRLQVELAALSYQRSRLVRSWTHLERQRGGYGFLGGPGESQLEIDRRLIDQRIIHLKRELKAVTRTRALHRRARRQVPNPVVALVGYTNAGKSTLFNRLTGSRVFADDRPFATLDPTMRALALPSGRLVILSDTVGFIQDLPTQLIAAFRATLEEVLEADVIVHVRDVAHPDSAAQRGDVHKVLAELGLRQVIDEDGLVEVLNKVDLLDRSAGDALTNNAGRHSDMVVLSALTGEGCQALLEALDRWFSVARRVLKLTVDLSDGASLAWLYHHGEVLSRRDEGPVARLQVGLDPADAARFERRMGRHHPGDR
ncbi:MAG: GTPase HflX [Kiloniellales bacterium]